VELWNDNNNNGVVDGGDTLRDTFVTLADGSYEFLNVPAGNYVIRETNPVGVTSSADDDTTAGNCGVGNGCDQIDLTLAVNSSSVGNDFYDFAECLVAGDCDDGLYCNGAETCVANFCQAGTDPCAGGGICSTTCNESTDSCFATAGTPCRAASGSCDVAETCTGNSGDCPTDAFEPTTVTCRGDAG
ncbi:MAG: hypothetical protein ABR587_09280, partial [Candidatus Binatia bacterium]